MQSLMAWRNQPIAIAPMMGWTTPAMQRVTRIVAPHMDFYTQMYHVDALIHRPYLIDGYDQYQCILQLGGSDPKQFEALAPILKDKGVERINLNVGCPSPRVQKGHFGACLMREPLLVADCMKALQSHYSTDQLSVKCRLGVDNDDDLAFVCHFIEKVTSHAAISTYIVHARKAWLKGLSPKQNRDVPPLNYPRVYTLKDLYPDHFIMINGGIRDVESVQSHLKKCDGVMLGRLACDDLYQLHCIDSFVNKKSIKSRRALLLALDDYDEQMGLHLQSLYKGVKNSRAWRRNLMDVKDTNGLLELAAQCE